MKWKVPTVVALVVVVVLAVGGALAGLVVQGPAGLAAGAAIGALAGVAAGYVPVFQDRAEQRRAEAKREVARRAEARERLAAATVPDLDGLTSGPSFLLRPEVGLVEFTGRETELAGLRAWCQLDQPRSVRVIAGPGGVGKTRLALQIGEEWQAAGRELVVVAAREEAAALGLARQVTSGPVLLVVDYAETRGGLAELLRAVAADPGPARVLLLARSLDEWWDRLREQSSPAVARLLAAAAQVRLEAPIADAADSVLAAAALPFFAARLGVAPPGGVLFDLPPGRSPVLVLHAAALVAVLRSMASPPGPLRVAVTEGVLDELLRHEAGYWRRAAASGGLPEDGRVLKAVIAAAILLGADNLQEAAAVAGKVPDLGGTHAGGLLGWARWLFDLYPAGPDGRLGSVQPDLLAEHHAATQLTASPALAQAILRDLTPGQAGRALTVLARAWELHEDIGTVIEAALRADPSALAIAAAAVAVQTQARVGELLASAFRDAPGPLERLIEIEEALPYPSVALAQADLAVTLRIRSELPPSTDQQTIARWASRTGILYAQAGRLADALPVTEEAVAAYRELAAADPDRYRPDLATSLSKLGARFSELGRPADGLPAEQEAVTIRRELAAAMPDRYRPDLARSLSNLGAYFSELGRPADALRVTEEAVAGYRELTAAMPDGYRPYLAGSLSNLGISFSALGRPADALPAEQEAVAIRRELAAAMPDRYHPDLADSLSNLSAHLSALGRPADALPAEQEAVAIRRELAAAMPDRYRPDLAASLHNLGISFSALGRLADALPAEQEAVAIRRELAAAMPDRYRPDLAASLDILSHVLSALDRSTEAAMARSEAQVISGPPR